MARNNRCVGNDFGIQVSEQAQPTLEANLCEGNAVVGIGVNNQAQPTLEANVCEGNVCEGYEVGIAYFDSASGVARNNRCVSKSGLFKRGYGIAVGDQAQPTLEANICNNIFIQSPANPCLVNNSGTIIRE